MHKLRGMTGFALVSLVTAMAVTPADAKGLRCRSDPAVVLSNGTVVDLSADIDAALWDVTTVQYTLHVPAGLAVLAIVRTPNWPGTKESFTILTDSTREYFDSTTVVHTEYRGVAVTARLVVVGLLKVAMAARSGSDRQPLRVSITTR